MEHEDDESFQDLNLLEVRSPSKPPIPKPSTAATAQYAVSYKSRLGRINSEIAQSSTDKQPERHVEKQLSLPTPWPDRPPEYHFERETSSHHIQDEIPVAARSKSPDLGIKNIVAEDPEEHKKPMSIHPKWLMDKDQVISPERSNMDIVNLVEYNSSTLKDDNFVSPGHLSHTSNPSETDFAKRLVIAIDYGTTFTGVAIAIVPVDEKHAKLSDITVIEDWGKNMNNTEKVPSSISYTKPISAELQWGNDMSPNAVAMVHTKLELDEQECKIDELEIILHSLDGMHDLDFKHVQETNGYPEYSPKKPDNVVKDFLEKVFARVMTELEYLGFQELEIQRLPVDIVFTVPVNWSYRAKNATYRAITGAGFNEKTFPKLRDITLLSEPEAAALYTARYLKEEKSIENLLKEDDCFIICDAGGGTVDVVTLRVKQLEPTLELENVGVGKSAKCGSVFIDGEFKWWLQNNILGPENYEKLEPNTRRRIKAHSTTGESMRKIMKQFIDIKQRFHGEERDDATFAIHLPNPFTDFEYEDVIQQGTLTIIRDEIEYFFDKPLNKIVKLIAEQAEQAEGYDRRVKNIFMIGGFGASKYLQSKVREAMEKFNIRIYQPDTSWTAVVRGAAMHGIEKSRSKTYIRTMGSPHYYGVSLDQEQVKETSIEKHQYYDPVTGKTMGKDQMTWIVHRGDLVLLSSEESQGTLFALNFRQSDTKVFTIPIYQYLDDDDNPPIRLKGAAKEMRKVLDIPLNFAEKDLIEFEVLQGPQEPYYQAIISLKVVWVDHSLSVEASLNGEVLYHSNGDSPDTTQGLDRPGGFLAEGLESRITL